MKILVVDDVKVTLITIARLLQKMGYNDIKQALLVKEAIQILDNDDIDIIISDWHMKYASGLDLLKKVRSKKRTAGIPFIMVTADSKRKRVREAVKEGINGYMIKPVNFQKLYEAIKGIAQKHNLQMPIGLNNTNKNS